MILSFKEQFIPKIIKGTKIHTIRNNAENRWSEGTTIHFATGIRTKNYQEHLKGKCTGLQEVVIEYSKTNSPRLVEVRVAGKYLGFAIWIKGEIKAWSRSMEDFAINDGFDSVSDFFKWFDDDYEGHIIHWTDFKY